MFLVAVPLLNISFQNCGCKKNIYNSLGGWSEVSELTVWKSKMYSTNYFEQRCKDMIEKSAFF